MRIILIAVLSLLSTAALAQPVAGECPAGNKTCKIIMLSPEQENVLDQLITQTCIAGPYAQIAEVVKFYKEMLAKAPAGTVLPDKPEPKK